ncbi:MAG TPA: CoA pyrophosphatase [Cyclobacteriaceae bacterium]|nr:CoA pyrophosphatase [Cyclobacteriaceae bacterium]
MIDFEKLVLRLEDRLKQPLPGPQAHERMRAIPVGNAIPRFAHKIPPKPGGVLIVLYPDSGKIWFPLIKRPDYPGLHSGQVSFPGGKTEPGEDAVTTALREGNEEIGIERSDIKVLGQLSNFFVVPSNFMVTPIVGYTRTKPALKADPIEVARILYGDLESILPDSVIVEKEILAAKSYRMRAPHFEIENEIVWGATAMMLNEFRTILNEILS